MTLSATVGPDTVGSARIVALLGGANVDCVSEFNLAGVWPWELLSRAPAGRLRQSDQIRIFVRIHDSNKFNFEEWNLLKNAVMVNKASCFVIVALGIQFTDRIKN